MYLSDLILIINEECIVNEVTELFSLLHATRIGTHLLEEEVLNGAEEGTQVSLDDSLLTNYA